MMAPSASLRRGFSWNLAGSALHNVSQWLLVVLLAQLTAPEVVGRFSLMLAIAAPVYLCLGLNLRIVVATDTWSRWDMSTYLRTRLVSSLTALIITMVAGGFFELRNWDLVALAALGAAKSTEALGQTIYGKFQRARRLDLVGLSMTLRAITGAGSFALLVAATGQLVLGCIALWCGWSAVYWAWDRRQLHRIEPKSTSISPIPVIDKSIISLVRTAAPLGLAAGLNSLTTNAPRYAIQATLGASGLAKFAALAYTTQTIGMVIGSLADGIISQLANAYAHEQRSRFVRLLALLLILSVGVTFIALIGAWLVGDWLVLHLLGRTYVNSALLLLLVVTAGITTLQRSLVRGLQASGKFKHIAWIDLVSLLVTASGCLVLVPKFGLLGGASALCIGMTTGALITAILVARLILALPPHTHLARSVRVVE